MENICDNKDCKKCFDKSFASYDKLTKNGKKKVECWSDKNQIIYRKILKNVLLISMAFMVLFTSFQSMASLQSP